MIRLPPRSTRVRSSAASDVYKRQISRHAIRRTDKCFCDAIAHHAQTLVSRRLPIAFIELLEMIQVYHHQRHAAVDAPCDMQQIGKSLFEMAAIADPYQRVGVDQSTQMILQQHSVRGIFLYADEMGQCAFRIVYRRKTELTPEHRAILAVIAKCEDTTLTLGDSGAY